MAKTIYRIMAQIHKQGIERTLPYEIPSVNIAEQTAEILNTMLEPDYHHYVVPGIPTVKKERAGAILPDRKPS